MIKIGANISPNPLNGLRGIDHMESGRLGRGQIKEGLARARLEIIARGFPAIGSVRQALMRGARIHVEQVGARSRLFVAHMLSVRISSRVSSRPPA